MSVDSSMYIESEGMEEEDKKFRLFKKKDK